ncbi:MAG: GDP-mannose 4,6-dehydratase [Candidatus Hodarchaeales archaeon]|jgi:UDP-glucose 4-epimerase
MKQVDFEALSNKKILITGGFGFVGTNLVAKILSHNIKPIILDYLPNEKTIEEDFFPFKIDDVQFYNTDIRKREDILHTLEVVNPDFIIHLASMTDLTKNFDQAHLSVDINIKGTLNLLEGANLQESQKFIFLSSSDVYGGVLPPFQETQNIIPASPYSVSKLSSELYSLMFNKVYDIPITVLRGFNLFGRYQRPNRVIPYIITELLNGRVVELTKGEQKREFNYIDNLIDAIILSLFNSDVDGEIINIGCGESVSIHDLALNIGRQLESIDQLKFGAKNYRPNEIWDMYCDNTKAKQILGWEPRISMDEGLSHTIEWFKSQRKRNG